MPTYKTTAIRRRLVQTQRVERPRAGEDSLSSHTHTHIHTHPHWTNPSLSLSPPPRLPPSLSAIFTHNTNTMCACARYPRTLEVINLVNLQHAWPLLLSCCWTSSYHSCCSSSFDSGWSLWKHDVAERKRPFITPPPPPPPSPPLTPGATRQRVGLTS